MTSNIYCRIESFNKVHWFSPEKELILNWNILINNEIYFKLECFEVHVLNKNLKYLNKVHEVSDFIFQNNSMGLIYPEVEEKLKVLIRWIEAKFFN